MAKPRPPKKSNGANEGISNPLPQSNAGNGGAEAMAAVTVAESGAADTGLRKTSKKPEIVRNDIRANLVPINVEEEIRQLAYLMAERRGFEPGHEAEDWYAAEREIQQRYRQQSA